MKTKNILTTIGLTIGLGIGTASCDDYLELLPTNDIVLENFWDSEEDVQQMVAACYSEMTKEDFMKRVVFWGEARSENMIKGNNTGTEDREIVEGNLMAKHTINDWSSFYNVINLCNTVMYYGPGVVEKDPDFLDSEMNAFDAEVRTLRALCYFYLVRTFEKVPLVLNPTIGNDNDFMVPATSSDSILDQIVADLQIAEKNAKKEFTKKQYNVGRITLEAIHALQADVHMWRQDYQQCAYYCDLVIESKREAVRKENEKNTGSSLSGSGNSDETSTENEYPLVGIDMRTTDNPYYSYNQIFGEGNSKESIFELQFTQNVRTNGCLATYYGNQSNTVGAYCTSKAVGEDALTVGNQVFKKTDIRAVTSFEEVGTGYAITKYPVSMVGEKKGKTYRSENYENWIFYRLSDIMLLKAEALTQLAKTPAAAARDDDEEEDNGDNNGENPGGGTPATDGDDQEMLQEAFKLTTTVYYRSQTGLTKSDSLSYSDYSSSSKMYDFVMAERHRELLFEGKRWFDLVRMALRDGNNENMLSLCTRKYQENIKTIKSKLSTHESLFFPYYTEELKVNTLLIQNPAYVNESSTTTAK